MVPATVPGGLWADGEVRREFALRPVSGVDEAFLLEMGDAVLPARRASALLARCLDAGRLDPLAVVRDLSVGDREALLLQLRRLSMGDRIECVIACPAKDCGEALDVELSVTALLLPPYASWPREGTHEVMIEDEVGALRVQFRVPTGADQEAAADLAYRNTGDPVRLLLRRCVSSASSSRGPSSVNDLSPNAIALLSAAMADRDPQAEIDLELSCPACGASFDTVFDATTFLLADVDARSDRLYREVHSVALHYHWSEHDILSMSRARRERYLGLIADARARSIS
jgi:hypothetical protein